MRAKTSAGRRACAPSRPVPFAGPRAIESYLDEGAGGRFLQSLKSSLASRLFEETYVYGWKFTLEDLIAVILTELREAARTQLGDILEHRALVAGMLLHDFDELRNQVVAARKLHADVAPRLRDAVAIAHQQVVGDDAPYQDRRCGHERNDQGRSRIHPDNFASSALKRGSSRSGTKSVSLAIHLASL